MPIGLLGVPPQRGLHGFVCWGADLPSGVARGVDHKHRPNVPGVLGGKPLSNKVCKNQATVNVILCFLYSHKQILQSFIL